LAGPVGPLPVPVAPLPVPVPLVPVEPVPEVPVMPVPDVSVDDIVPVMPVPEVSVDIVPVVPVEDIAVSVDIVDDESVDALSVVLLVFSVLLQATTPKSATSARARKMTSDFFMNVSLLSELMRMNGVFRGKVTGSACLTSFELL